VKRRVISKIRIRKRNDKKKKKKKWINLVIKEIIHEIFNIKLNIKK